MFPVNRPIATNINGIVVNFELWQTANGTALNVWYRRQQPIGEVFPAPIYDDLIQDVTNGDGTWNVDNARKFARAFVDSHAQVTA